MNRAKIKGLHIWYNNETIGILKSHQIKSSEKMLNIIKKARERMNFDLLERTNESLVKEWRARNRIWRWTRLTSFSNCVFRDHRNILYIILCSILGYKEKEKK